MRVRLSTRAEADLAGIRDYLVARNPQGAENVRQAIEATIDLLAAVPGVARATDIAERAVLPVVHYPYLVYHTVQDDELVVVHVRHAARVPTTSVDF